MRLDERAAHAAEGIRHAVSDVEGAASFDRRRERHRRQRALLPVVTAAAATAAILVVAVVVRPGSGAHHRSPAAPLGVGGRILYGVAQPKLQESSWFTIAPDGTSVRDLRFSSTCASWLPGGDKILVSDDAYAQAGHPLRPATIKPDGTGLHRLDAATNPKLNLGCGQASPDGSVLALEGFGQQGNTRLNGIYLVRSSDGGGLVRLTHSPVDSADGVPRFAPDGRRIVFLRNAPGTSIEGAGALYVTTTTGAAPRRITPLGSAFLGYDWSPDGQWIVFQRPYGQLYVVHPDGTALHRLPIALPQGAGAQNPTWGPDSNTIAFSLVENGRANVYTVRMDGSRLHQITNATSTQEQSPDWSH